MTQYHNIQPVYNNQSQILILGSFPSVKSREGQFFYHHPQNRFWKVLAHIYHYPTPTTVNEKKEFLLKHHIALWDVIARCDIQGSSDSSIANVVINDISKIVTKAPIQMIYTNGQKAHQLYQKHCLSITHQEDICLPSTSPANATYSLEKLIEKWNIILQK